MPMIFTPYRFDDVPSTINELVRLADDGAQEGTYVTARKMSAGRGRNGRPWVCAEGNLFFSLLLRPKVARAQWGELSFVSGLATGETIGTFAKNWLIKWPNDVLVDEKKISGILLETHTTKQGDDCLIVGIGINIAHAPEVSGREVVCLADCHLSGSPIPQIESVLGVLLERFDYWYDVWQEQGFAPVRDAWLKKAAGIGKKVRVQLASGRVAEGLFSGLAPSGALELKSDTGELLPVLAGDVFLL